LQRDRLSAVRQEKEIVMTEQNKKCYLSLLQCHQPVILLFLRIMRFIKAIHPPVTRGMPSFNAKELA
jgi:hypothetical protein